MDILKSLGEFIRVIIQVLRPFGLCLLPVGLVAVLLAFQLVFQFGVWRKQAGAADERQKATTAKTPREVVRESRAAHVRVMGCYILALLVVAALVVLALAYYAAGASLIPWPRVGPTG
jgi:hypothetical protein